MYDLGYLQEIDHDDLPTVFENMRPEPRDPDFDPERKFSIPWQSGMTGIWVDTAKAPEIKSVNDLFDPKYKGKVTMLDRDARHRAAGACRPKGSTPRRRPTRSG